MHPVLFQLGSVTIYTYGVLVAAGVLLAMWYSRRIAPSLGVDPDRFWNLGIYSVLSGLLGAKLWLLLVYWHVYWANPRVIFSLGTLQSGGTFYGGLVGGIFAGALYTRLRRMPLPASADVGAIGLQLGHAVGRLGCFAAGCCWGKPTGLPWGVTFTDVRAAAIVGTPIGVSLHPTQLYEAAAGFANFALLVWLAKSRRFEGQIAAAYLMLYGLERGALEFLRGDPERTPLFHGAFTLMQIVSVAMIVMGAWIWLRGRKRPVPIVVRAGPPAEQ